MLWLWRVSNTQLFLLWISTYVHIPIAWGFCRPGISFQMLVVFLRLPCFFCCCHCSLVGRAPGCSHPSLPWALQGPGKAHIPKGSLSKQGTPRLLFILSCSTVSLHLLLSLLFCFTQIRVKSHPEMACMLKRQLSHWIQYETRCWWQMFILWLCAL